MQKQVKHNPEKLQRRWGKVLNEMKVQDSLISDDQEKKGWLAEYAENHGPNFVQAINESFGSYADSSLSGGHPYHTLTNTPGYGPIVMPQPGITPGKPGTFTGNDDVVGSGDISQNYLPIAMKLAAQTIGLDLVAVRPTQSPVFKHVYVDFKYGDGDIRDEYEHPIVFILKLEDSAQRRALRVMLEEAIKYYGMNKKVSGLEEGYFNGPDRLFLSLQKTGGDAFYDLANVATLDTNRHFKGDYGTGATAAAIEDLFTTQPSYNQRGASLEFLGFSRIKGLPIFRTFRQINTPGNAGYQKPEYNTFQLGDDLNAVLDSAELAFHAYNTDAAAATPAPGFVKLFDAGDTITPKGGVFDDFTVQGAADGADGSVYTLPTQDEFTIEEVSALEDHLEGFVANWSRKSGMVREEAERTNAHIIYPDVFTADIQVGDIEVMAVLKRQQIEDIKAATGIDIVQKMEGILVNELSQKISKEIVGAIFELGDLNRESAPTIAGRPGFDFDVRQHIGGMSAAATAGSGETFSSVQRKLWTRISAASNYIHVEGRIGQAQYLITNYNLATSLMDLAGNQIHTVGNINMGTGRQLYPAGTIGDLTVYVDPNMLGDDNRIVLGRRNSQDEPGLLFVPYLMAQSVSIIAEATMAPKILLRSRYAIARIGFFPEKQYMTMYVLDPDRILN